MRRLIEVAATVLAVAVALGDRVQARSRQRLANHIQVQWLTSGCKLMDLRAFVRALPLDGQKIVGGLATTGFGVLPFGGLRTGVNADQLRMAGVQPARCHNPSAMTTRPATSHPSNAGSYRSIPPRPSPWPYGVFEPAPVPHWPGCS